jgi:uncharacterized protein YprB with RNaseH-like and TPR domain
MPNQIDKPTQMLTWAAHWLGEPKGKVVYRKWDDPDFLTKLHEMLDEADMTVGYNHAKFDHRHINREFVLNSLPPTRPVPMVDMLKVVKQRFMFPHNRLDYVAGEILGERKLETGGFDLWPAFMAGEAKAEKTMRKYNIQDTLLTERLYKKLRPWVNNHPNVGEFSVKFADHGDDYQCECCGSTNISLERPRRTRCFAIRVVKCNTCGHHQDGSRKKLT